MDGGIKTRSSPQYSPPCLFLLVALIAYCARRAAAGGPLPAPAPAPVPAPAPGPAGGSPHAPHSSPPGGPPGGGTFGQQGAGQYTSMTCTATGQAVCDVRRCHRDPDLPGSGGECTFDLGSEHEEKTSFVCMGDGVRCVFNCNSGLKNCGDNHFIVREGASLDLNCDSAGQCEGAYVKLEGGGLDLDCSGDDACKELVVYGIAGEDMDGSANITCIGGGDNCKDINLGAFAGECSCSGTCGSDGCPDISPSELTCTVTSGAPDVVCEGDPERQCRSEVGPGTGGCLFEPLINLPKMTFVCKENCEIDCSALECQGITVIVEELAELTLDCTQAEACKDAIVIMEPGSVAGATCSGSRGCSFMQVTGVGEFSATCSSTSPGDCGILAMWLHGTCSCSGAGCSQMKCENEVGSVSCSATLDHTCESEQVCSGGATGACTMTPNSDKPAAITCQGGATCIVTCDANGESCQNYRFFVEDGSTLKVDCLSTNDCKEARFVLGGTSSLLQLECSASNACKEAEVTGKGQLELYCEGEGCDKLMVELEAEGVTSLDMHPAATKAPGVVGGRLEGNISSPLAFVGGHMQPKSLDCFTTGACNGLTFDGKGNATEVVTCRDLACSGATINDMRLFCDGLTSCSSTTYTGDDLHCSAAACGGVTATSPSCACTIVGGGACPASCPEGAPVGTVIPTRSTTPSPTPTGTHTDTVLPTPTATGTGTRSDHCLFNQEWVGVIPPADQLDACRTAGGAWFDCGMRRVCCPPAPKGCKCGRMWVRRPQ